MREQISDRIAAALTPEFLSVVDDSAKHAGHAGARPGGNTHFSVEVVSSRFAGKSRVERHRMIYDALKHEIEQGVHALAIVAKTPDEAGA